MYIIHLKFILLILRELPAYPINLVHFLTLPMFYYFEFVFLRRFGEPLHGGGLCGIHLGRGDLQALLQGLREHSSANSLRPKSNICYSCLPCIYRVEAFE